MRSRRASAATARAFSLVLRPDVDPEQAARLLADTCPPPALEEAIAHLRPALFGEDDRVVVAASSLLVHALSRSSGQASPRWPLSPTPSVAA